MNEKLSRKIDFETLKNTRDLGGMPAADGRKIRSGLLIRSGMLCEGSEADIARLSGMIELILDFRTEVEHVEMPDPDMGVPNVWIPTLRQPTEGISRERKAEQNELGKLAMDPAGARRFMSGLYANLAEDDYSQEGYRMFVRYLAEPREKAVLWHCSAGKDRAGLAALITQEILGVPRDLIFEDYLATNVYLDSDIEAIILGAQRRMAGGAGSEGENLMALAEIAKGEARRGELDRAAIESALPAEAVAKSREALHSLFGAERDYPEAYYRKAEELCGSFDAYLEQVLGVTPELREELRSRYLE